MQGTRNAEKYFDLFLQVGETILAAEVDRVHHNLLELIAPQAFARLVGLLHRERRLVGHAEGLGRVGGIGRDDETITKLSFWVEGAQFPGRNKIQFD